jgi:hypothetical protein
MKRLQTLLAVAALWLPTSVAHASDKQPNKGRGPALALVAKKCPRAESEAVERCAFKIVQQIDARLHESMCAYRAPGCADRFAKFTSSRDALTQAFSESLGDDSVNNRIDAALFALRITLAFEQQAQLVDRRKYGF